MTADMVKKISDGKRDGDGELCSKPDYVRGSKLLQTGRLQVRFHVFNFN